jgi:hypothetical protein
MEGVENVGVLTFGVEILEKEVENELNFGDDKEKLDMPGIVLNLL